MTFIVIFFISGLATVMLIASKKLEVKLKKPLFISNLISKGDTHIKDLYHRAIHLYSDGKEKISLFFKRHVPIHSKNFFNKLLTFLKEKRDLYSNHMRDSRLLKKSDGISEFFKNMSEVEKGNGEIHDIYEDSSQNIEKEVN